jgi:hypothetical protein
MRLKIEFEGDARELARFLESQLHCKTSIGGGFVIVDVDLSPGRVRGLLKRFLYKSGYRDHKVILGSDGYTVIMRRVKGRRKAGRKGRGGGSYPPPPSSSLPYFFPG